ncbi:hypothetical protein ACWD2L_00485 [Streptomyces sp. NPDC002754]
MLREPQGTPPHLALTGDPIRRLGAVLRHAARVRRPTDPVVVDEVVIEYAGTEWTVNTDDDEPGNEWWEDPVTGTRRLGSELTRGEAPLDQKGRE